MDEDGYLKVTDFGLSEKLNRGDLADSFVGTFDFMAPEILIGSLKETKEI